MKTKQDRGRHISDKTLEPAVDSLLKHYLKFAISPKPLPVDEHSSCYRGSMQENKRWSSKSEVWSNENSETSKSSTCQHNSWRKKGTSGVKRRPYHQDLPGWQVYSLGNPKHHRSRRLSDRAVNNVLKKDPTMRYKDKMLKLLRIWKREGAISDIMYDKIYPTSEEVPKFYGLPQIPKKELPSGWSYLTSAASSTQWPCT